MPKHARTFRQLLAEADRIANGYFDPQQKLRRFAESGHPANATYVVLAQNCFVPLSSIPGITPLLRRFVRGDLDTSPGSPDQHLLKTYWSHLDAARDEIIRQLATEGPCPGVAETARNHPAWPAVGLAESEDQLRSLLTIQFERISQARIPWLGVDSSTHYLPIPGGLCVHVDWFWHGSCRTR